MAAATEPLVSAEAAAKAVSHPLRAVLLLALSEKDASPNELAKQLDEPLTNVSYHVRMLADLGCIELVDTEPVRGALEHFYRAVVKVRVQVEEVERNG